MGNEGRYGITDLLEIMKLLRSENGCPWDREQDHKSIRDNVIEEAYEVADAIDRDDASAICEELGDLLLQVVFHAQMAQEANEFNFDDVCDGICKNLILRHPHVFAEVKVNSSSEVLDNWDAIKRVEKHQESVTQTLQSVPAAFPAVMRAQKVQKRACKGAPVLNRDTEQAGLLLKAAADALSADTADKDKAGDMLFAAAAFARACGTDGEQELQRATDRFVRRFGEVEQQSDGAVNITDAEAEKIWSV